MSTIIQPKYLARTEYGQKPFSAMQIGRQRALLAFTLRSWGLNHRDIVAVLKLRGPAESRRLVDKGRRLFIDCVANTVI